MNSGPLDKKKSRANTGGRPQNNQKKRKKIGKVIKKGFDGRKLRKRERKKGESNGGVRHQPQMVAKWAPTIRKRHYIRL